MANFIYCKCGGRTPQGLDPVRFCSACGEPFAKTFASTTKPSVAPIQAPTRSPAQPNKVSRVQRLKQKYQKRIEADIEDEDTEIEDEDEINEVPELDSNPFSVKLGNPSTLKIGDIAGSVKEAAPIKSKKTKAISQKKFMEEFRREAGTAPLNTED